MKLNLNMTDFLSSLEKIEGYATFDYYTSICKNNGRYYTTIGSFRLHNKDHDETVKSISFDEENMGDDTMSEVTITFESKNNIMNEELVFTLRTETIVEKLKVSMSLNQYNKLIEFLTIRCESIDVKRDVKLTNNIVKHQFSNIKVSELDAKINRLLDSQEYSYNKYCDKFDITFVLDFINNTRSLLNSTKLNKSKKLELIDANSDISRKINKIIDKKC